jgi:hypothetical protein
VYFGRLIAVISHQEFVNSILADLFFVKKRNAKDEEGEEHKVGEGDPDPWQKLKEEAPQIEAFGEK